MRLFTAHFKLLQVHNIIRYVVTAELRPQNLLLFYMATINSSLTNLTILLPQSHDCIYEVRQ